MNFFDKDETVISKLKTYLRIFFGVVGLLAIIWALISGIQEYIRYIKKGELSIISHFAVWCCFICLVSLPFLKKNN